MKQLWIDRYSDTAQITQDTLPTPVTVHVARSLKDVALTESASRVEAARPFLGGGGYNP